MNGLCPDCGHPWDEHAPAMVRFKPKPESAFYSEGFAHFRQPEHRKCRVCGCKATRPGSDPWSSAGDIVEGDQG